MGDLPVTALARSVRGDLFAGTDFGVLRLPSGHFDLVVAGSGPACCRSAGLTMANGSQVLYAATHRPQLLVAEDTVSLHLALARRGSCKTAPPSFFGE